jgi:anti-sigma factor RsiW
MVEFLADYLAGDLGSDERSMFERHLVHCADCLAYLRSYRATVRSVREVCTTGDELPEDVPEALLRAIVAARKRPPGRLG